MFALVYSVFVSVCLYLSLLAGAGMHISCLNLHSTLSPTSVSSLHPSRLSSLVTFSLEAASFWMVASVADLGYSILTVDRFTSRHKVISDATLFQLRQTLDILRNVKNEII